MNKGQMGCGDTREGVQRIEACIIIAYEWTFRRAAKTAENVGGGGH